jgi:hypothetical protein
MRIQQNCVRRKSVNQQGPLNCALLSIGTAVLISAELSRRYLHRSLAKHDRPVSKAMHPVLVHSGPRCTTSDFNEFFLPESQGANDTQRLKKTW